MKTITKALSVFFIPFVLAGQEAKPQTVHDFKVQNITGEEVDLADYKGKTVLIVNVASQCGATPQYKALQDLYEGLKDRDFVILGFPSNDFGGQEPGTNIEIANFCKAEYAVTFPMFSKISTKGENQAPLYKYLTAAKNPDKEGDVGWNFEKFLIGKDGKVLRRFVTGVKPDSDEVTAAIKDALGAE